jgi:ATP-dependent Clp protease ATP-binding subunit ClpA
MGQDDVIDAVCRRLLVARYGVGFEDESGRRERRPRATFFFAGPTGVGKTELAKALAWLLFGDEAALISFDMTEYRDQASAGRLVGSDPGYVGYEQGGQLTNAVLARPYSVLLFDEAEKAEPRVLDVFIQILDEGRLTDGRGHTVSFGDTIVIFTSNAGSGTFVDRLKAGSTPSTAEVREHFELAVKQRLSLPEPAGINRPELYGRLGDGVLGFDMLRPDVLCDIVTKFTVRWQRNASRQYGVTVDVDVDRLAEIVEGRLGEEGMVSGARSLHTHLSALLDERLADAASSGVLVPDRRFTMQLDGSELTSELRMAEA